MDQDSNQLLEYTIDTLLKTFNPDCKPIMKKVHFYKMMDILDTRLQDQDIDIGYPKYWYRYGSVAHLDLLDELIPYGFSRYWIGNSIVYPAKHRRFYEIDRKIKHIINSTIENLRKKYQYKQDYGRLLKKDSYKLNSPYIFNTTFQYYLDSIDSLKMQNSLYASNDLLEPLLDKLLAEFPENDYPELLDTHLAWDDTTRLVLDHMQESKEKYYCLEKLTMLFWGIYSKAIRIDYNQHIPKDIISDWEQEYGSSIHNIDLKIEEIRNEVIENCDFTINTDDKLIKKLMQKIYELGA